MDSYPEDLKEQEAFETMRDCILECPGVSEGEGEDGDLEGPALASGGDEASATESAEGSQTSESSAARKQGVVLAGAAAAGFGALAFVL